MAAVEERKRMAISNGIAMPCALVSLRLRPLAVAFLLLQGYVQLSCCGSAVEFLPGFQGPLPFRLETGVPASLPRPYQRERPSLHDVSCPLPKSITLADQHMKPTNVCGLHALGDRMLFHQYVGVGESEAIQLFYYFIESERNPQEDALFIWLTGGPGCSAFSGLIYEIGPLNFKIKAYNRSLPELVLNPYSWTKASSIIFVDSPVGTGFSYAENPLAYETGDLRQVQHLHQFIRKWLISHPQFISNPVYVGGDSYSGLIVPVLVQEIMDGNDEGQNPAINIQGYVLGNPGTEPGFDQNAPVPFAHGMGLISDELYESLKITCRGNYQFSETTNAECVNDLLAFYQCISGLQTAQILEPLCGFASPKPGEMSGDRRSLTENFFLVGEPTDPDLGCRAYGYTLSYSWTNDDNVREALHIRKGSIGDWQRCNYALKYTNDISSTLQYHEKLSAKGCRSLIYSGDHDMIVPYLGTQAWIRSLNYSIVDDWRRWMVQGQVAGYTRTYSNGMTFATVKGGGHTAPEYKPEECFAMYERWISQEPL